MKKKLVKALAVGLCVLLFAAELPAPALAAESDQITVTENATTTISVKQGQKVTMKVTAKGKNLKYQWYYRKNAKASWKKYSGKTKSTLSFKAGRVNGYQYRCKVYNSAGSAYSKVYKLKVDQIEYRALIVDEAYYDPARELWTRASADSTELGEVLQWDVLGTGGGTYDRSYIGEMPWKVEFTESEFLSDLALVSEETDSNDVTLFYFSGEAEADGSLVINKYPKHTLSLSALADSLRRIPGKVIVILEADYSGQAVLADSGVQSSRFNRAAVSAFAAADRPMASENGTAGNAGELRSSKFYVLTSCGSGQTGSRRKTDFMMEEFYTEEETQGDFNYYLCMGLTGGKTMRADADKNGTVTLGELYKYLSSKLSGTQDVQVYPSANSTYGLFKKK